MTNSLQRADSPRRHATALPSADAQLAALRGRIDELDDALLELVSLRQTLSAQAGTLKPSSGDRLKIRPGREVEIIDRLIAQGPEVDAGLIRRIWRELLTDGVARQSPFTLAVWGGDTPSTVVEAARRRFGFGMSLTLHETPQAALEAAEAKGDVAILALDGADWWSGLRTERPDLWAFDLMKGADGETPAAVAVGRVDEDAVAHDRPILVVRANGSSAGDELAREGLRALVVGSPETSPPEGAVLIGYAWDLAPACEGDRS